MTLFSQPGSGTSGQSASPDELQASLDEFNEIERGLLASPGDCDLLLRAARWGERMGRHDEACSFYLHAAAAAPTRTDAIIGLSDALRGQSHHEQAVKVLQDALERLPAKPELWCAIARVMSDVGAAEKADLFLAEALRLDPNNPTARLQRGALHRPERHVGADD
jgi:tetratricopeptide (TPR) repeat protein